MYQATTIFIALDLLALPPLLFVFGKKKISSNFDSCTIKTYMCCDIYFIFVQPLICI